jgi:predicted HicB family RNase H-like nuclease
MARGLRSLSVFSTLVLLTLPLAASSAVPVAAAIVAIVGPAWTAVNLVFVGARSAAFAQADEVWVSDPPNITPAGLEAGNFETSAAEWNTGAVSAVSIAPATAPSGNAITVRAETKWEPLAFQFSPQINISELKLADNDGVLWGKGFAFGTFKGIVTKEYGRWGRDGKTNLPVAELPLRYVISDISLPYAEDLDATSFNLTLRAWRMDDENTDPEASSWHKQILLASASLDGPNVDNLQLEGSVSKDDFLAEQDSFRIRLQKPVEGQVVLRVAFPNNAERIVIALRAEATGSFQVGKR